MSWAEPGSEADNAGDPMCDCYATYDPGCAHECFVDEEETAVEEEDGDFGEEDAGTIDDVVCEEDLDESDVTMLITDLVKYISLLYVSVSRAYRTHRYDGQLGQQYLSESS